MNVLDVRLLDLFAELEAVMRCAREVQRNLIRLRERIVATPKGRRPAEVAQIGKRVAALAREAAALQMVVRQVADAGDDLRIVSRTIRSPARSEDQGRAG